MGTRTGTVIARFTNEYRWASNFGPCTVVIHGTEYRSGEAAYQAQKSTDPDVWRRIAAMESPAEAKRYGRRVKLRPDWEQVRKIVMLQVVLAKFAQNPDLARLLTGTEDAMLIEGNTWHDNFWGSCTCPRCGNGDLNYGLNYLGRILMMVRDIITVD